MGIKTSLCAALARCFNAHLTDKEKEIKAAADQVRKNAAALNESLARLAKLGVRGWIHHSTGYRYNYESVHTFRIDKIEVTIDQSRKL